MISTALCDIMCRLTHFRPVLTKVRTVDDHGHRQAAVGVAAVWLADVVIAES